MKIALTLITLSLLLAGCTSAGVDHRSLGAIKRAYRSITPGMTREEVEARLGEPDKTVHNTSYFSASTVSDSSGVPADAALVVHYDVAEVVVSTEFSAGEDRRIPLPISEGRLP